MDVKIRNEDETALAVLALLAGFAG